MPGYRPDKPPKLRVSTRNPLLYRAPAVLLIGQLKETSFEGELELVDTAICSTKIARKDYAIGLDTTGNRMDDPDSRSPANRSAPTPATAIPRSRSARSSCGRSTASCSPTAPSR